MKQRSAERKNAQSGIKIENKPSPLSPFAQPKPFVKNTNKPEQD